MRGPGRGPPAAGHSPLLSSGEGPRAHLRRLAECIRWSYGAGVVLRLGNIARLELNYCVPMGVQKGDRWAPVRARDLVLFWTWESSHWWSLRLKSLGEIEELAKEGKCSTDFPH